MKIRFCGLGCVLFLTFSSAVFAAKESREADEIRKSLVRITNVMQRPDYRMPWIQASTPTPATGTGFIIEKNQIMTNAHVVSDRKFLVVEKDGDPKKYVATVKFVAHDSDLAILELEDTAFFKETVPLVFGDIPTLGSKVVAYGYPLGWERYSVTEGVVSRVDFRLYTHSGNEQHLVIQIDAAINPGNSGGPILQNGKVVGVAFQSYSGSKVAENMGFMIPTSVVRRFFRDVADGKYDGYAIHGFSGFPLINFAQREALGLEPAGNNGMMVGVVYAGGAAAGVLEPGDVILEVDGIPVFSDGNVQLEGRIVPMSELMERKLKGETIVLKVLRNRKEEEKKIIIRGFDPSLIHANQHDERPEFILFGGMVFQPLNRSLVDAYSELNSTLLRHYYSNFITHQLYVKRPEVVVLTQILPDPVNTYFGEFVGGVVEKVNEKEIKTLRDLAEVLAKPEDRMILEFVGGGRPMILKKKDLSESRERIRNAYNIKEERYLNPKQEGAL